jgi:sulfatase modifying factor 1
MNLQHFRSAVACPLVLLPFGEAGCGARSGLDLGSIITAPPDVYVGPGPTEADAATGTVPPSCQGGGAGAGNNCGASGVSDCCANFEVPPGTFNRSFANGASPGKVWPATVSSFRLDAYEVTVSRFRKFVSAVVNGWRPAAGSGKHTHLNGGRGLADALAPGSYETGWDASWNVQLAATESEWDKNLGYGHDLNATWTPTASTNETRPITLEIWYEAYAFCIWDGGFLPSEAEWYYAAAGGSEQRTYPWGAAVPGPNADLAVYGGYYNSNPSLPASDCTGVCNIAPVGSVVAGNSKWGQSDMAGNMQEWTLDWFGPFTVPCTDCASLASGTDRVQKGGSFSQGSSGDVVGTTLLFTAGRIGYPPTTRYDGRGHRCARTP